LLIDQQLARLGVKRLLLAVHDVSFPSDPDEDIGRGSPATRAAGRLFAYARAQGFTGFQLGPEGQTSRANPSPYDGTIFSRHTGNIGLAAFAPLVEPTAIARARLASPGGPARHAHAFDATHALVDAAYAHRDRSELAAFRAAHASWLDPDALYAALAAEHGTGYRDWPADDRSRDELARVYADAIDRYAFGQLLAHREHARVRALAARYHLALYGDLHVGYADGDAWAHADAFLRDYRMGAPPSRTNPAGQAWGYPVLDPDQYGPDPYGPDQYGPDQHGPDQYGPDQYAGRALALVRARFDKTFAEYDSVRIDHPHGLVCPWVYRAADPDAGAAVRAGARLFDSPDLPPLARYAIARTDQLDHGVPRYADDWVTALEPDQVARYGVLVDAMVACAVAAGRDPRDLSFEVLSTMPRPLGAVLERHGFGRWRVLQKANLADPSDVYRSENAARADWVMLGNHDTAPIFAVIAGWSRIQRDAWARHLAARLKLPEAARLEHDGFVATAMLAELFASRAENVSIFFADLFGYVERFNVPGLVDAANWSLRLPADFEALHAERLAAGRALDLELAAELALAARA
jgi:4-alpha-glucanotransferase